LASFSLSLTQVTPHRSEENDDDDDDVVVVVMMTMVVVMTMVVMLLLLMMMMRSLLGLRVIGGAPPCGLGQLERSLVQRRHPPLSCIIMIIIIIMVMIMMMIIIIIMIIMIMIVILIIITIIITIISSAHFSACGSWLAAPHAPLASSSDRLFSAATISSSRCSFPSISSKS
jgi:hypothetical protein